MMRWLASKVCCVICTNEWVAVAPESANEDELECDSCGAQDSEVVGRITKSGDMIPVGD